LSIQPVSALVAAIVCFAIGCSVLLRDPRRRSHVLFATFAFNIALWSALSFVAKRFDSQFFDWVSLVVAVSLPATAQRFFQAFLGDDAGPPPLSRVTVVAPSTRIDVALPADVAVADLLPMLLDMAKETAPDGGARHGGWALAKLGDAPLDPSRTLASLGVVDGELLQLRKRNENPIPPVHNRSSKPATHRRISTSYGMPGVKRNDGRGPNGRKVRRERSRTIRPRAFCSMR